MQAETTSRPPLPRRALLGAALAGVTVAAAAGLGWLGALEAPQSQDFRFSRGSNLAQGEAAKIEAYLQTALLDDRFHVTILGHSGTTGDAQANRELSQARADAVAAIATALGLSTNRITATALGGSAPLTKASGQSDREFQSSLARATISLQSRP